MEAKAEACMGRLLPESPLKINGVLGEAPCKASNIVEHAGQDRSGSRYMGTAKHISQCSFPLNLGCTTCLKIVPEVLSDNGIGIILQ
jgi:hypothetical protein